MHHSKLAYRIPEFCELIGLSRPFVYREIKAGRLKTRKAGRATVILHDEAMRYLTTLRAA